MKPKVILIGIVVFALYLVGQKLSWDSQRYDYVTNYMYQYTSPKMRSVLAAGHDALMADLAMVRGIQFYGMMNTDPLFRWNHLTSFAEHGGPNKSFRLVRER